MSNVISATRRSILAGGAAIAAVPLLAAVPAFAGATTPASSSAIAVLWAQAEKARLQLAVYAAQIKAAHIRTGLPGWMHVAGRANELGSHRYDLLVAILKCEATSQDDLAIVGKVTTDHDMVNGPKSWAHGRFDVAAMNFHSRAA